MRKTTPRLPGIDAKIYTAFWRGGSAPLSSGKTWTDRVAAAMLLGICPVSVQIAGRLERSELLRFLSSDTGGNRALGEKMDVEIGKCFWGENSGRQGARDRGVGTGNSTSSK
jgi:hypothetical protein